MLDADSAIASLPVPHEPSGDNGEWTPGYHTLPQVQLLHIVIGRHALAGQKLRVPKKRAAVGGNHGSWDLKNLSSKPPKKIETCFPRMV